MKTLHLTLKKKWFDLYLAGIKKEEYREIKPYWARRLCCWIKAPFGGYLTKAGHILRGDRECLKDDFIPSFEKYDVVKFTNGYSKNAPSFTIEFKRLKTHQNQVTIFQEIQRVNNEQSKLF